MKIISLRSLVKLSLIISFALITYLLLPKLAIAHEHEEACLVPIGDSGIWESCEEAAQDRAQAKASPPLKDCQVPIGNSGIWESCAEAAEDRAQAKASPPLKDCQVEIGNSGIYEDCASAAKEESAASAPVKDCQVPIGDSGIWESCAEANGEISYSEPAQGAEHFAARQVQPVAKETNSQKVVIKPIPVLTRSSKENRTADTPQELPVAGATVNTLYLIVLIVGLILLGIFAKNRFFKKFKHKYERF